MPENPGRLQPVGHSSKTTSRLRHPAVTSGFRFPRDQVPLLRMPSRKSDYTILPQRKDLFFYVFKFKTDSHD